MTGTMFPFLSGNTPGLAGAGGVDRSGASGAAGGSLFADAGSSWLQPLTPMGPAFENALSAAREDLQRPFTQGNDGSGRSAPELGSTPSRNTPEWAAGRTSGDESVQRNVERDDAAGRPEREGREVRPEEARSTQSADGTGKQEAGEKQAEPRGPKETDSGSHPASEPEQTDPNGSATAVGADDDLPTGQGIRAGTAEDGGHAQTLSAEAGSLADPDPEKIAPQTAAVREETHQAETAAIGVPNKTGADDRPASVRSAVGDVDAGTRPLPGKPADGAGAGSGTQADARFADPAGAANRFAGNTGANATAALKIATADGALAGTATGQSGAAGAHASENFAAQLAEARNLLATHAVRMIDAPAAGENLAGLRAAAALPYRGTIPIAVNDPAFSGRFAAEVALLGAAGVERAEIRLHPRELGPVRIELSMSGDAARIAFSAAHPDTRHAIEQSLPLLKDLLAERGLQLGNANVSDHGGQSQERPSDDAPASAPSGPDGTPLEADRHGAPAGLRASVRQALLSIYA